MRNEKESIEMRSIVLDQAAMTTSLPRLTMTLLSIWRFPSESTSVESDPLVEVAVAEAAVPLAVPVEDPIRADRRESVWLALALLAELVAEAEVEAETDEDEGATEVLGAADELGVEDDDGAADEVVGACIDANKLGQCSFEEDSTRFCKTHDPSGSRSRGAAGRGLGSPRSGRRNVGRSGSVL
jgi:hypothetical protein